MLKNIDPLLTAELLGHLQSMGHGDVLALVDRNYPAVSTGSRVVTLPGIGMNLAAQAIFSVFPIDTFVEPAVYRMGAVGNEAALLEVHHDFQDIIDSAEQRTVPMAPFERFEFYRRAAEAYVVVATSEYRPYGCFLVTKGVI